MSDRISRRQALRITAAAGVSLALGGGLAYELVRRARLHRASETRTQMGTLVTVTVLHPDADRARAMVSDAFLEIERLEALLSRHRADTPVGRLSREGIVRDAPPELTAVLGRALEYSALTGGAFDITVAPLLDVYRSRLGSGESLRPGEVEAALSLVDYRRVRMEGTVISLERPGMAITLDGIAKGYVVDRAVARLAASGAERVLVEAGGDLATAGNGADEQDWRVAIQNPHDARGSLGVLHLRGEGVASSGDYIQTFTEDRRLHHILDPRTGRSPEHTSGVTVVARTAMDADALSTSAFVMGPEEGLALLEGLDGVEGLIVTKDGTELATRGFERTA